jgi:HNH endonuclease
MIAPLVNEYGDYCPSFTLRFEKTRRGYPTFRFEFRPRAGFWLDSEWFVPSTLQTDTIQLINRLCEAKGRWDARLQDAQLDPRLYFEDLNSRISLDEQIAYREGHKPLTDLSPLDAAYMDWGQYMARVKQDLREAMGIDDICMLTPRSPFKSERYFAYRRGVIWESPVNLYPEQWKELIDAEAKQRGMTIGLFAIPGEQEPPNGSISAAVRREVWRRDQGKCVGCGSQQRLEFDHVVPVAKGGSNTARNIQLLCERCNREKAATVG